MRVLGLIACACALLAFVMPASAVTGPVPEFKRLADGVYAYVGKRNDANAMVVVTNAGVVIADTGNNTTDTRELMRHIRSVTDQPVRYIVITQNHGDHIGGTPFFSPPAAVIVHERVAKQWAAFRSYQINSWRKRFAERAEALKDVGPIDTAVSFRDYMTLHLGGREIELIYVEDEYNPGDVAVWLPKDGVLHASFAGYKDRHPDIRPDYSHGTTAGMLKQLEAYIALKPKIVVPAHGPVGEAKDLEAMVDYLLLARRKVRQLMDQNLPSAEIERRFDMAEFKGWDRTEHLPWAAATIHRELLGEGPVVVRHTEQQVSGVIETAMLDGRRLTLRSDAGTELRLRISADTDVEGIPDRTGLKAGMRVSVLYQIPDGMSPELGYDALEVSIQP